MTNISLRPFLAVFLAVSPMIAFGATATTATSPATATSKPTTGASFIEATPEAIGAQIKRVKASGELKDQDKKALLKIYEEALATVQTAAESKARGEDLEKQRINAPILLAQVKEKLEEPVVKHTPTIPKDATLAQLEQRLVQAETDLSAAKKALSDIEDSAPRAQLRTNLPKYLADAKQQLEAIRRQQSAPLTNESQEYRIAHRTQTRAKRLLLQNQIETCEIAIRGLDARIKLSQAQRTLALRKVAEAQKQVDFWQEKVDKRRQAEADLAAKEAAQKLNSAPEAVRKQAEENAKLAQERSGSDGPAVQIPKIKADLEKAQKLLDNLTLKFEGAPGSTGARGIKGKVDKVGVTNSVSVLLRKERANLPDVHELGKRILQIQPALAFVGSRLIQLEEDREWYADTEARVAEVMSGLRNRIAPEHRLEIEDEVRRQFKQAIDLNAALIDDYDTYTDKLIDLDTALRQLRARSYEYAGYIDERVFWFCSTTPLSLSCLPAVRDAGIRLFDPAGWRDVGSTLVGVVRGRPVLNLLAGGMLVLVLFLRRWYLAELTSQERVETASEGLSFALTVKMLGQTLLSALVWPAFIFFLLWQMSAAPSSDFVKEIIAGLLAALVIFTPMFVLIKICRTGGIADRHFHWSAANVRVLRGHLIWFMLSAVPLIFAIYCLEWENDEAGKNSLGRLAFITLLVLFALFMYKTLGPVHQSLRQSLSATRDHWIDWTHYLWFPLAIGVPAALALAAALGYYYTAMELAWRILLTVWLMLAMLLVREMLLRWVFVANRRLALRKKVLPHAVRPAEEKKISGDGGPEINAQTINLQARKLLDSVIVLILALCLWQIWADVLPALGRLKQVNWQWFTLFDLVLACVILLMTYVANKNLPGMLEITVLLRLPLDSGLRFAITAVSRYVILFIGFSFALGRLGLTWDRLQWLMAAMMVGLSFGMQEIFANFISGLIILFERPMRVGDIVTVGNVTGKVTRIQIRATTITDSDRKELIVPNKEFITGRVVNWTLSDRVLRLAIPVGIAYGSDTDLAQKLLMKVARSNPRVLPDPSPSAAFTGFGASAMSFELGVFTTIDNFDPLRHELNTAITKTFKDAGIQIP